LSTGIASEDDASPASSTTTIVSDLTSDNEHETPVKKLKPAATRGIFELESLKTAFEKYAVCPKCQSGLVATFPTCCIASGLRLQCSNEWCDFVDTQRPATANIPLPETSGSPLIERNTDYAINILYVLGFLASGDGGVEAGRILGLLGLPNSTTMEKRSFTIIEQRIGPILQGLCQEILQENLDEEVAIYYGDAEDENGHQLFDLWKANSLPVASWPRLKVATDMGWQKRSSGRNYSSLSGHALFVALLTRKPICLETKHKVCRYCKIWHINHTIDIPVPEHDCVVNHVGSSGSMEALAVLAMYIRIYEIHHVVIDTFITDDDSTIKAKLKWSNADHMIKHNMTTQPRIINSNGNEVVRPDYGEVPAHMPEPGFLADPGHRKKTLKGDLYRLEKKVAAVKKTMTKCDCVRVSTNYGYMSRTLPGVDEAEFVDRGRAVLEHHFDNHQYCGSFCHRKDETPEQIAASTKYYRDKVKDKELYDVLHNILARFVTLEALREVGHGFDTLVNKSLNNTISWVAPKNKTYSTSQSLDNRISVAVGINGLGVYLYFCRLFILLGIDMTDDISHYLQQIDARRTYRILKSRDVDQKKKRQAKFHDMLKEHTETAKKQRCKRDGAVYEPGIGMEGAATATPPTVDKTIRCGSCKEFGHKSARNKMCKNFKPRKRRQQSKTNDDTAEQLRRDAAEQDLMDAIPFIDGEDEFFDSFDNEDELEHAAETGVI